MSRIGDLRLDIDDYCTKPLNRKWLLNRLRMLSQRVPIETLLIVDDEEVDRYILKGLLSGWKIAHTGDSEWLASFALGRNRTPGGDFSGFNHGGNERFRSTA
jgi:hypothetical protein